MQNRLLIIYLQDHLAAGRGGIALARRMASNNKGNEVGAWVQRCLPELEEDAHAVHTLLAELGSGPSRLKMAAAWAGEKIGRLKLNGRLLSYSPLSRLYELEGLSAGATARQSLWRTVEELAREIPSLQRVDSDRYQERAERQQQELRMLHRDATNDLLEPVRPLNGYQDAGLEREELSTH